MRLDLHGYTVHEAWKSFNRAIDEAYFQGEKKVVVITGQGAMMREIMTWAHNHHRIRDCTQTPYNPGSFTIKLKKRG